VGSAPDGTKAYVLILSPGDEILTALTAFANDQKVQAARFTAIGGVHDPEVAWFDEGRKQFKAMTLRSQLEVASFVGDVALGPDGKAVVHAHAVFAGSDGHAWGGHVLSALVSPTFELFITTYPTSLHKRDAPEVGITVIDPSIAP
jgi:predicted DNA-binding protein with PD1-like motif